jgi:ubiquitin-like 1-activating enzyme E1 A
MSTPAAELSEQEAAIYDRQLRVWGVETQRRLSGAKVLIAGCGGLAVEVSWKAWRSRLTGKPVAVMET